MRWQIMLTALLLSVAPASAQDPLLTDPEGDQTAYVAGEARDPPIERYGHMDLVALDWRERQDHFEFTLHVADLSPPAGQNTFDGATYEITFHFGGVDYMVGIQYFIDITGTPRHYAYLWETAEENGYVYRSWRADVEVETDEGAGSFTGVVPREAIISTKGAPPSHGDLLEDIAVRSEAGRILYMQMGGLPPTDYWVEDRMPDEGAADFEILFGIAQTGHAALSSPDPFRLSNGGATSLIYQVYAQNLGQRQAFHLEAHDVPAGWTVSLPFARMVLEEDESRSFPVLVTTESGHRHGGSDKFLLTMAGTRDAQDVGRVELGIKYTDIPQPAGHHPKLWFHTFNPWQNALNDVSSLFGPPQPYMNALEDDPTDTGDPAPAWGISLIGTQSRYYWYVPIMPQLGMGLDFDTKQDAAIEVTIDYDYLAQDVVLTGNLIHESPEGQIVLGQIVPTEPASWSQGSHTFEVVMGIQEDADFVPYTKDARMYLDLQLQGTYIGVGPYGPGSEPKLAGGWVDLPLNEYRDRVDTFYNHLESLRFDADFLERPVNPAKTVVFQTHLRNAGTQADTIQLNLTGINVEWARVLGDSKFELAAGKERKVAVAVEVPADAPDGVVANLVLQAHSTEDPFRRAVIDLIAVIDTETDHSDEADQVGSLSDSLQGKKSPGFEIAAIGLGLLALVLLRKR